MDGLGQRLRARSLELGWSDSEVARRAGLAQTRYANYVADRYEPDLSTFKRICAVLGASASEMLASPHGEDDEASRLRGRVLSAIAALEIEAMRVLAAVSDALVARAAAGRPIDEVSPKVLAGAKPIRTVTAKPKKG